MLIIHRVHTKLESSVRCHDKGEGLLRTYCECVLFDNTNGRLEESYVTVFTFSLIQSVDELKEVTGVTSGRMDDCDLVGVVE